VMSALPCKLCATPRPEMPEPTMAIFLFFKV
jgi:hypothetical protein